MLMNLRKAMDDKRISTLALAQVISVTEKTANNKINEQTDFTLREALAVKDNLFPEYDLCFLFAPQNQRGA